MKNITLADGNSIPMIAYGVFKIAEGEPTVSAVAEAIKAGYRHFDTAQGYWNEKDVGEGIRRSGIDRSELTVATKMWMYYYRDEETAYRAICQSVGQLGTGYIDLMMLHQAVGDYYSAWRAMVRAKKEGLIRSIGVSNFTAERLADLCIHGEEKPVINQIHIGPFEQKTFLEAVHTKYGVAMETWSPLGGGDKRVFENEVLNSIGTVHGKSGTQVILRWLIQRNIVTPVRSTNPGRMRENLNIFDFELSDAEMAAIAALNERPEDTEDLRRAETTEVLDWVVHKHADKYTF